MREDRARLSELLTLEGGKPRIENLDEVEWCAACFDYYGEIARNSHGSSIPPVAAHQVNFTIKEPLGVVGCIVPFNYPLLLMTWKVAPAIAAGNTVVIKPSELTPLSTLRLCETAWKDLPAGVVNVVTGTGADIGEPLIDDPDVACIAFTGSTAVGTRIAVKCAEKLKRVNLELGGIDPLIVFEDADLDVAVRGAAWARYLNAGQVCTSAKRIYVVDSIAREFVDRFVAHTKTIKVGHGMDPEVDMGPLISAKARDRVEDQVKRAVAQGAKVLYGGKRLDVGPGWFYAPTILTEVRPDHAVHCEEVFGPIASIQVVKDGDEAIALAARSEYGLGANVFTRSLTWAMKAMAEIKAGTFWINDPPPTTTPRRSAACARAAWGASSARRGSTRSARPSTSTSTTSPRPRATGSPTRTAARRSRGNGEDRRHRRGGRHGAHRRARPRRDGASRHRRGGRRLRRHGCQEARPPLYQPR